MKHLLPLSMFAFVACVPWNLRTRARALKSGATGLVFCKEFAEQAGQECVDKIGPGPSCQLKALTVFNDCVQDIEREARSLKYDAQKAKELWNRTER